MVGGARRGSSHGPTSEESTSDDGDRVNAKQSHIELDAVIEFGTRLAGVADPEPDAFRSNLELLVGSINDEAGLRPGAARPGDAMLGAALAKRIQISHWTQEHPEIRAEPIVEPLFLTGLPRSGTTYFQYLFDSVPAMRMLRTWEGDQPCPPPAFDPAGARHRRDEAVEQAQRMRDDPFTAEIAKMHLTDADGPQECLAILDQTFANPGAYWTYSIPTYFDRLLDTIDYRPCYEHHKLELQLLQWQAPHRRWVLKWPCHLLALPEILDVYPDVKFVVTHRDPVQALASNASLTWMLRSGTSVAADRHQIGRQMKDMILRYIERLVAFDVQHAGTGRLVHVDYQRVVDDPETVMTEVFDELGLEMTPLVLARIGDWRRENPPGKRGVHEYSLGEYGLDAHEVAEEYAFYTDRFDIPTEGAGGR